MFDAGTRASFIAAAACALALSTLTFGCAARQDASTTATVQGETHDATVGGAVTSVDGRRVVIREARSGSAITIEFASEVAGTDAIHAGDCVLASGTWTSDSAFAATKLDSLRSGCR